MQICSFRMSCPLFRYRSVVQHYTPRKPTVLERALLKVHARLAGHEKYARTGLGRIFSDVLSLPDPDALVQPTLEHLLMLQVFQSRADISTLGKVAIQDLERTARGDQMLQDDLLPAAQVDDLVTHVYDPIRRVLVDRSQPRELRSEAQPVSLSHEPFRAAHPAAEIAAAIPRENHPWWHPNSVVGSVRRRRTEELWYDVRGAVVLSEQGQLSVELTDEALTSYVNGLDADTLVERILQPALYGSKEPEWLSELEERDFTDLRSSLKACAPLSELATEVDWSAGVRLVRDVPGLLTVPEHAPSRTVIVVFGDANTPGPGAVSWNADQDGACVRLPDAMPVPCVLYYNGNGCCLGAARLGVQVNGLRKEIALGYAYEPQHVPLALRDALTVLEQKLAASEEPRDACGRNSVGIPLSG